MNQKGFIPIAILIGVLGVLIVGVIGTAFYVKQQQNNSQPNTNSASQEENISISPSPSATNNSQLVKSTPSPTSKPSTKPSPTSTKAPTNTPTPQPTIPQPTIPQPTPTPTPIFSTAKPVLTVTGPYTIGESGPCFDLSSKHPYNYTQSANYKFDENESSYRYTSLRDDGYSGKATVCWVKDSSKTGKQYVFKAKSYVDVYMHDPIYSDEVSVSYTHP